MPMIFGCSRMQNLSEKTSQDFNVIKINGIGWSYYNNLGDGGVSSRVMMIYKLFFW